MPQVIKVGDQKKLIPTSDYKYAKFPFDEFNCVQSRVCEYASQDVNMVIAAKTGVGKTYCAEMFLGYEVRERGGKGMYLAPLKALAAEKADDWTDEGHHFSDQKVSICTGDFLLTPKRKAELDAANIVVMSCEMLNSRCRNSASEASKFLTQTKTLVVDEAHLLTVPGRGDHLENGIIKYSKMNPDGRLVFLSATMPNVDQIGNWLSKLNGKDTIVLESDYRPVPLFTHYDKYDDNAYSYDGKEDAKCWEAMRIIDSKSEEKFLVFGHTKKTVKLMFDRLKKAGYECEMHTSDLEKTKRRDTEKRFRAGKFQVLVATSGLAWGCYQHGMMIQGENGRPVPVEKLFPGDKLLCPVGTSFENRKVIKVRDFKADIGYYVKTSTGEEMVVSEDHLFFGTTNCKVPGWVKVTEMKKGDWLATPNGLNIWNKASEIDNFWYMCGCSFGDKYDCLPKEVFDSKVQAANFLSGLFDADGGLEDHSNGNKSIGLTNISKHVIRDVKALLLCFNITSSVGRKRMKSTVINGRHQVARRKWIHRLRIFGVNNFSKFVSLIGFRHPDKKSALFQYLTNNTTDMSNDLVPARVLLKTHIVANGLNSSDFTKITGSKLTTSIKKQDCQRRTIQKLLDNTKVRTGLNDLIELPYRWVRISEVRKITSERTFREIEIEDPHAYVGCGVVSHNCNFPARNMISLGVHRGMNEVPVYDIEQMKGRAGRPGYDTEGHAYILLPSSNVAEHVYRLQKPQRIESQLFDVKNPRCSKVLAFHLVSEIHRQEVKTRDNVKDWFSDTLACYQNKSLDLGIVENTVTDLMRCGAVKEEDNVLKTAAIGKVASMFYFSPFDVSDLSKNFTRMFKDGKQDSDYWIAACLGWVDSHKFAIVSNAEKEEMVGFEANLIKSGVTKAIAPNGWRFEGATKAAYGYYCCLRGIYTQTFLGLMSVLKFDIGRVKQVLQSIDAMGAKWDKKDWLFQMEQRIRSGVPVHLLDVARLDGISKVKGQKLYDHGLTTLKEIAGNVPRIVQALSCTTKAAQKIADNAKELLNAEG